MDIYAENILDHYRHPRNKGALPHSTTTHREENASCGDDITVHLILKGDVVEKLLWEGSGCALSQAGMSMLAESLEGSPLSAVENLTKNDVQDMLGVKVGPRRFKCAFLCLHALKNALLVLQSKRPQTWPQTVGIEN